MSGHPHDTLFKKTFGQSRHARALLRRILPGGLSALFDWKTLRRDQDIFVTRALRERRTDLLYTVRVRGRGSLAFVLLEHQSRVKATMALRLLRYMVLIWEQYRKEHRGVRLPAIVPVVVYNGRRGWRRSPAFRTLYDLPSDALEALAPHLTDFAFVLNDLTRVTDAELVAHAGPIEGLVLHCLANHANPRRLYGGLDRWVRLVRDVETEENAAAALRAVTEYICGVSRQRQSRMWSRLERLMGEATQEENVVQTVAEQLMNRGRREGGVITARSLLIRQLARRFGRVSKVLQRRINGADVRTVEKWCERFATASSVAEVFGGR